MSTKVRVGIVGYGNVGRGVEVAIRQNEDMELVAGVTRRAVESVKIATPSAKVVQMDELASYKEGIDGMI